MQEGSSVTVLIPDEREFTLGPEEETALLEAIAEAERVNWSMGTRCWSGFAV